MLHKIVNFVAFPFQFYSSFLSENILLFQFKIRKFLLQGRAGKYTTFSPFFLLPEIFFLLKG